MSHWMHACRILRSSAFLEDYDTDVKLTTFSKSPNHMTFLTSHLLISISLILRSLLLECRVLLLMIAEDFVGPLESLVEVTWTAKELYAIIYCAVEER
uniref:U box n=1 Tax=Solanum tuberosum TaxID=4113 RepID=M1D592_SOLTU